MPLRFTAPVELNVPGPVREPFKVAVLAPMVSVNPLSRMSDSAAPRVKLPPTPLNELLTLRWTGLFLVAPIVTPEVAPGTAPADQLPLVFHAFEEAPVQLVGAACAAKGANARAAVVIRSCLR
jgi:hypothetical protein